MGGDIEMKLKDTYICLSCEELFTNGRDGCPSCGDVHYYSVVKWLGTIPDLEEELSKGKTKEEEVLWKLDGNVNVGTI